MKYDKLQTTKTETAGFTLVEIVAVLVLLGILAAVAVPKFFDLSSDAEKKAAEAALAEAQVRINAKYSKAVYAGKTCAEANVKTLKEVGDDGKSAVVNGFTLQLQEGDELKEAPGTLVMVTTPSGKAYNSDTFVNVKTLFKPSCSTEDKELESSGGLSCPEGGNGGGSTEPAECAAQVVNTGSGWQLECTCSSGQCSLKGVTSGMENIPSIDNGNPPSSWGGLEPFEWDGIKSCVIVTEGRTEDKCASGLAFRQGGEYYFARFDAWSINSDLSKNPGLNIEDTQAFKNGQIIKIIFPLATYNKNWSPVQLTAGNVYHGTDDWWYGFIWEGRHTPEVPTQSNINSNGWIKLNGWSK